MAIDDKTLVQNIQNGARIQPGDPITTTYRSELTRLMVVFVDSELSGAAGFTHFINSAPTIKTRVIAARIVSEKLQHADDILTILKDFGVNPELYVKAHAWDARLARHTDLGIRRMGGDKRLNVFHYPIQGWVDALVMNTLMGSATLFQLEEYQGCSYGPLSEAMDKILPHEKDHAKWGQRGLAEVIADPNAKQEALASIAFWYPKIANTFGRSDSDAVNMYLRYGLRKHSNSELINRWQLYCHSLLSEMNLLSDAVLRP